MVRRLLIAGNWKMNKTMSQAVELVDEIVRCATGCTGIEIALFPPYLFIAKTVEMTKGTEIAIGAQDVSYEESGAYTGEIAAFMLKELSCRYVIVGHSERRRYAGEKDAAVNRKIKKCLEHGLYPILCVGETLHQRREGKTQEVLNGQIVYGFEGIDGADISKIVIAYEPVWAIGTGMSATEDQAQETQSFIRDLVGRFAGEAVAEKVRILYGGSVNEKNAHALLVQSDIDGALVGGASLKSDSFCEIIRNASLNTNS
jgi:triosephosphate isomerase